jgi:hypothetical protein
LDDGGHGGEWVLAVPRIGELSTGIALVPRQVGLSSSVAASKLQDEGRQTVVTHPGVVLPAKILKQGSFESADLSKRGFRSIRKYVRIRFKSNELATSHSSHFRQFPH